MYQFHCKSLIVTLCLVSWHLASCDDTLKAASRSVIGNSGIIVPKRSSLIYGLNEQFKPKPSILSDMKNVSILNGQQQSNQVISNTPSSFIANRFPVFLLGPRALQQRKLQQQQQSLEQQALAALQEKQALYLDKHQQELLAANPNLPIAKVGLNSQIRATNLQQQTQNQNGAAVLTTLVNPIQSNALSISDLIASQNQKSLIQTIPLGDLTKQAPGTNQAQTITKPDSLTQKQLTSQQQQQQQQQQLISDQQMQANQQYKGYSLIEMDIKSDVERRFMRDLYSNLSALVNEQANNYLSPQVSTYIDVDFWSFGRASSSNDQIDVMVSPRSKPFILAQLSKAKIRHRIKIDDIQARIDKDQANHNQVQQNQLDEIENSTGPTMSSNQFSYAPFNSYSSLNGHLGKLTSFVASGNPGKQRESSLHARQANDIGQSSQSNNVGATNIINGNQKPINESTFFENYQRLALINQYLEYIVQRDSDVGQVKVIGRSSQGRHLRVLKLGYERIEGDQWDALVNREADGDLADSAARAASPMTQQGQNNVQQQGSNDQQHHMQQQNPMNATLIMQNFFRRQNSVQKVGSIWLDGGTHAREWISVSTVLYLAFRLSDNHNRCSRFFNGLKSMVHDHDQSVLAGKSNDMTYMLTARRLVANTQQKLPSSNLPVRSEMEQMLELIAKNPQLIASEYGCDLEVDQLLRRYTFYIMPVINPDGYEYSHTHNRLWRKTRSTSSHPIYRHFCLGVDPNRNYDAHHGSTGSSSHPCSQTFAGATPFTEPETRHQSNFVYANRFGMKMYISFHSYSQMILLPLSHSRGSVPDLKDLESVANAASKAIEQTHGTQYRVGQSAAILYTAAGTASDWAYEKANIKYSYTIELRDTGSFGFLLPRQQIIPTGEETFNGLLSMIGQMEKNDNLLTSKSSSQLRSDPNSNAVSNNQQPSLIDYNKASQSDLDRLNAFGHSKQRAQLESVNSADSTVASDQFDANSINAISSSDSSIAPVAIGVNLDVAAGGLQAMAGSSLKGVRDRRPVTSQSDSSSINSVDSNDQTHYADPTGQAFGMSPVDPLGQPIENTNSDESNSVTNIDREPDSEHDHNHDGDAGYAFEGEGELMEPANQDSKQLEHYYQRTSGARAHVAETHLSGRRVNSSRRIHYATHISGNGRNSINTRVLGETSPIPRRESSANQQLFGASLSNKKQISKANIQIII